MITQARLKELLHYDPDTGVLTWLVNRGRIPAGAQCGSESEHREGQSYRKVTIDGKNYLSHRLAWLYIHGDFPDCQIDHKNGDGTDNRLANLRDVTNTINQQNRTIHRNNKSGFTGVRWHKHWSRWTAIITVDSNKIYLGSFDNKIDAVAARMRANKKYGFHENHGQSRHKS